MPALRSSGAACSTLAHQRMQLSSCTPCTAASYQASLHVHIKFKIKLKPQSLQAAKLRDDLAVLGDDKPYITYQELLEFIKAK